MKTKVLIGTSKIVTGTGIAAGILASSAAHAQTLDIQNPNLSLSDDTVEYFNLSDPVLQFSTQISAQQVVFEGPNITTGKLPTYEDNGSSIRALTSVLNFTGAPLNPGDTVDDATITADLRNRVNLVSGTGTYGFEFDQNDGAHFGYITVTQTGAFDPTTGDSTVVDTLNTVAYDATPNEAITVVPEPSTLGLLGAAATGLVGLSVYRRRKA